MGRKSVNLETEINKLHDRVSKIVTSLSDARRLFDVLEDFRIEHELESQLYNETASTDENLLYLFQPEIESAFNSAGKQISEFRVEYSGELYDTRGELFDSYNAFNVQTMAIINKHQKITLLLTPLN
ncbi:hypothetical protein AB4298_12795 [Shewanella sp. 10N.261.52.F9]|uniref:hypothetical protein n=1 Tax=Shewanella sp. 10N.261.52.F9 TaxID=3229684 RepID=UPI00355229E7